MKYSAIISTPAIPCSTAILQGALSETLFRAKSLGYDGVQLTIGEPSDYDLPTLKAALAETGLCVTGLATGRVYTVFGCSMGSGEESNRTACVKRLCALADVASELGGAQLIIGACRGKTSDAPTPEIYFSQFERSVREILAYAAPKKVPVILELIDHLESDAYYKPIPTAEFVKKVDSPWLKMYLDTMHLIIENEDIPAVLREYGKVVPQIDISGEGRCTPMDSAMDFPAAMAALADSGFDGVLTFEVDPATHQNAAEESIRYIKGLFCERSVTPMETTLERISFPSTCAGQTVAGYFVICPKTAPHAILQITHGMAEHWLRYEPFARFMAQNGFVVCGHDHLGHGETSGATAPDGFFAEKGGAEFVLQDIHTMTLLARERFPGLPLILFGHSMGSFFARWAASRWPDAQDAAIFCGTGGANPAAPAGLALTTLLSRLHGPRYRSKLVNNLAFGSYLKRLPDAKTPFDWLSADEENIQRYLADPKCGFLFTVSAFHDLMTAVQTVNTDAWAQKIKKSLPILVVAGAEDPVANYGEGPREVAARLCCAGVKKVDLQLYPGMRHEILNEADHDRVFADLLVWCEKALPLNINKN